MTVHCGDESETGDQLQDMKRYDTNGLLPEMSMKLVSYILAPFGMSCIKTIEK